VCGAHSVGKTPCSTIPTTCDQQATKYRELAKKAEDIFVKQELLELADICEEAAN
jgi:hypothetical protein